MTHPVYAVVDLNDANVINSIEDLEDLTLDAYFSPAEAFDAATDDGAMAVFRVVGNHEFERID